MKTWNELTEDQQERAIMMECESLLRGFVEGSLLFAVGTKAREIFDDAVAETDRLQAPWLLGEVLWERLEDAFRAMAHACCGGNRYGEPDDPFVVWGVIREGE